MAFASNTFTDVDEGRYYTDAVGWAADNGVTTGTSATTFSPENAVTRAQNVTFAYRYDQNVVQPALNNITTDIAANNTDIAANAVDIAALETLDELSCAQLRL
ncbi:MAG: S-layer homology domain-containing protein [Acidimicrobiales bacterium]|nr:S-layer homology domain-containing protein [Acidimicrobiales bacterium]